MPDLNKSRVCRSDVTIWIIMVTLINVEYTMGNDISGVEFIRQRTCVTSYSTPLDVYTNTRSNSECARKCSLNANCASFLYNQTSKVCITNKGTLFAGIRSTCMNPITYAEKKCAEPVLPLSTMGKPCISHNDCSIPLGGCFNSTCGCEAGYSFDPATDMCVDFCTTYGTTFQLDVDHVLNTFNNEVILNITADACKAACIQATSFVCRTAEFQKSIDVCYLSNDTALSQPDYYLADAEYDFMQRDCAYEGVC